MLGAMLSGLLAGAADDQAARPKWEMDYGPFLTTSLTLPSGAVVPKGIVVRLGNAAVCFDTDLVRYAAGWTGGYLELLGPSFDGTRQPDAKTRPKIRGALRFTTPAGPGWGDFRDPRPEPYGPLPADIVKYRGLYLHGERVVFSYTVGACSVLDMPGFEGDWGFLRSLTIGPSNRELNLLVAEAQGVRLEGDAALWGDVVASVQDAPSGTSWDLSEPGRLRLRIPPRPNEVSFPIILGRGPEATRRFPGPFRNPREFTKGGPPRFPQAVETRGVLGATGAAYELDVLTVPEPNPWNSWMRFTGLDFFPDGRAALATWSGDVWIVSGIDSGLERITWKRYASGLYQPGGLKIVDGRIYVVGRDQITRFHDLAGHGEADFYENFNNDCAEKGNYHEFAMDLLTDSEGNFYYAKGGLGANFNGGPIAAHHGCFLKISRDGSRLEIVATGIRAGAGSGIGPEGQITVSDQDGHWGPASRISLVRKGAYFGDPYSSHLSDVPRSFEPPICWIHRNVDNSSASQVWVTSGSWGPFQGRMLHLSYGTCSLFRVLMERVGDEVQGGVVRFPITFGSGSLRGSFHPKDGQLYVAGLRGWSTSASRDGAFERVRYTGRPVRTVSEMHLTSGGIILTFTCPLDRSSASDPASYGAQWWNYAYTKNYGSPDYSVAEPKKKGRDTVEIASAALGPDSRTVTLHIPGLRPVMQLRLEMDVKAEDGAPVRLEILSTIHRVP